MKKIILSFVVLFNTNFYAQVNFEKGYIIDNNNIKTECLIKNLDWLDNPTEIEIKMSDSGVIRVESVKTIKEFKVDNSVKYVSVNAMMDLFYEDIRGYTTSSQPVLKKKNIFLRLIIEGEASLYEYQEKSTSNFFYSLKDSNIEQLTYKKYLFDENSSIATNNDFRIQLSSYVKCETTPFEVIENLNFNIRDLSNYFASYNSCNKNTFIDYRPKKNKGSFNFKLKAGFYSNSFSYSKSIPSTKIQKFDFENKSGYNAGLEAEYVLPFNKNKWSVYLEQSFHEYNSKVEFDLEPFFGVKKSTNIEVNYKHINLDLGARHYMYLNTKSKLFLNIGLRFVFIQNGSIKEFNDGTFENATGGELVVVQRSSFTFGVGYSFNNKFTLEIKQSNYNILKDYLFYTSSYNTTSLIFGYTIFNTYKK